MSETEIVFDCSTGQQAEVVMTPDQEAAFLAMRAQVSEQQANPPPTKEEILQDLLDSVDPDQLDNDALQIMLLVQKEQLRP
jgi:hypothetical protein